MTEFLRFAGVTAILWAAVCAAVIAVAAGATSMSSGGAGGMIQRVTRRFIAPRVDTSALLSQLDPSEVRKAFEAQMERQSAQLIQDVLRAINPGLWDELRPPVRQMWIDRLRPSSPRLVERMVMQIRDRAEQCIDLAVLVGDEVRRNPAILRQISLPILRAAAVGIVILALVFAVCVATLIAGLSALGQMLHDPIVLGAAAGALAGLAGAVDFARLVSPRGNLASTMRLPAFAAQMVERALPHFLEGMLEMGPLLAHMNSGDRPYRSICREAISQELDEATGDSAALVAVTLGASSLAAALDAMADAMADSSISHLQTLTLPAAAHARIRQELERQLRAHRQARILTPWALFCLVGLPVAFGSSLGALATTAAVILLDK